jgi:hypothetical protein
MPPPGLPLKGRTWRLSKAVYGLKQAAHVWFEKWTTAMIAMGFKPSQADPCLFIGNQDGGRVLVGLYVDDALMFGNSHRLRKLVEEIQKRFEIKDMGFLTPEKAAKFLGIELRRVVTPDAGIFLSQRRYAELVLERFGMNGCTPVSSPMAAGVKLSHEGEPLPEEDEYAAMVGCMLYLNKTRLDLAYALSNLSKFMSCPREPHLIAA